MTKWFPALDEIINDIVNVWEGDAIENVVGDENTANMIEDQISQTGELPTWLDPNIELGDVADEVKDAVEFTATAVLDFGFGKTESRLDWWPLSIPLTLAALGTLVVLSR